MMKIVWSSFLFSILLTFSLSAQTPRDLMSYLPAVEGWEMAPEIEVFDETNLHNRINDIASLFFEYNFREMTSLEYRNGNDRITIQAYRHASQEDAFGMYAFERSPEMTYSAIGGEGQEDESTLFFFVDSIYVKISASNKGKAITRAMHSIAKSLADRINPKASYPEVFGYFPKEGRLPYTEAYVTQNYIGRDFLKPVYTIYYDWKDRIIQLFMIDGETKEGAEAILKKYFELTNQPAFFGEGRLAIADRYNGLIPIIWKGRYIIGVYDETAYDFPDTIYELLNGVQL